MGVSKGNKREDMDNKGGGSIQVLASDEIWETTKTTLAIKKVSRSKMN